MPRRSHLLALPVMVAASAIAGACGGDDSPEAPGEAVALALESNGIAGGLVRVEPIDDATTRIIVGGASDGGPASGGEKPVHLHEGTCAENAEVGWSRIVATLEPTTAEDRSVTVVDVPLERLLADDHSIDLHLPRRGGGPDDPGTESLVEACADIRSD